VAVIGAARRTVITTCSYEARAFGVKTGMTVGEGLRACPSLILAVGDNRKYTWTSSQIIEIFREFTPLVEVFSIDEAFLDVTGSLALFGSAERIASLIKGRIGNRFGITCSIGIAPNKLLAKLASDMQKPDGLTVIRAEEVEHILDRIPVKGLCGIGGETARQLALYGIETCGDLGRFPTDILKKRFGIVGERLSRMGRGIDDSPVVPVEESAPVKSVGHSMTLDQDMEAREEILACLLRLSEMVGRRARRYNVRGKTVTLSVRYADYDTWMVKQETLQEQINDSRKIYRTAAAILDTMVLAQPVRLLGIKISNLQYTGSQFSLFPEERKKALLAAVMDGVNDRYGDFTVTFGNLVGESSRGNRVISPAWRPSGIRNVEVT